jgi:hypothetical protein
MGPAGVPALLELAGPPTDLNYVLGWRVIRALARAAQRDDERVLEYLENVARADDKLRDVAVESLQKLNPDRAKALGLSDNAGKGFRP